MNTDGDSKDADDGFSLIELIVVVVVLGIIAAIAIPVFLNVQDNARQSAVEAEAASALTPVQEDVLHGITAFGSSLSDYSDNENVELSLMRENELVAGDPDSVCVQASWLGADNVATAGAGCLESASEEEGVSEEDEEIPFSTTEFVTTWQVDDGDTITVPATINGPSHITWEHESGTVVESTHEGDNPESPEAFNAGEVKVTVEAEIADFRRLGGTSVLNFPGIEDLTHVNEWPDSLIMNASYAFNGATSLEYVAEPPFSIEDMRGMFSGARSFNQDISDWDVSNVKTMKRMFYNARSFNNGGMPLDWVDTSSLKDTNQMFRNANRFNQDISNWDMSDVQDMSQMFHTALSFNNGDAPGESSTSLNWDVSSATNMRQMFHMTYVFNQDISDWDVSNVTNMESMFFQSRRFDQNLGDWNTSNVINMNRMFDSAISFNHNISNWNVSSVTANDNFHRDSGLDTIHLPDFNH